MRLGHLQRLEGGLLGEVAQETQDQLRSQAPLGPSLVERAGDAVNNRGKGNAAIGMALRIEEDLDMADIVGGAAGEVCVGEVVEISLCL